MLEDMMRPPVRPKTRTRERAQEILDRQFEAGLSTLELAWAKDALAQIQEACPTLAWEETVRLFRGRSAGSAESVLQAALFLEWNRTHGDAAPSKRPAKTKVAARRR